MKINQIHDFFQIMDKLSTFDSCYMEDEFGYMG